MKCIVIAKRVSLFEEKCSGMNVRIPFKPYTVSTNKLNLLFTYILLLTCTLDEAVVATKMRIINKVIINAV